MQRPRPIIEQSRRKPEVNVEHCVPIKLANGVEFFFRKPSLKLHPIFKDGKAVSFTRQVTLMPPELNLLVEGIAIERDGVKRVLAILLLGALMLQQLYDVTDEECGVLFRYQAGNPDSERMLNQIMEVATGAKSKPDKVKLYEG